MTLDPATLDLLTTMTGHTAEEWQPALDKLDQVPERAHQIVQFCIETGMGPDAVDGLIHPAPPAA